MSKKIDKQKQLRKIKLKCLNKICNKLKYKR